MRRLAAVGLVVAGLAIAHAAHPLVPESERLTGADLASKHLVLTFDRGPSTKTLELSSYLKTEDIHATFFVDGRYADQKPALETLASDGHLLGNRASTNRDLVTAVPLGEVEGELAATDALIAPYRPWNRKVFRAPFGSWTNADAGLDGGDPDAVYDLLKTTPLDAYVGPIFWNIDADCTSLGVADCAALYLQRIHARSNGIVRFDDTDQTLDVVKTLVPVLVTEGYSFDALDAVPALGALFPKCDDSCSGCTGPSEHDCSTCPSGARLVDGQCLACTVCQPGNYVAKSCAADADTLCTPCADGTYQPAPGATSCLACGDCSDGDPCTTDRCQPVVGCTHTRLPSCPSVDAAAVPPTPPDAGGSKKAGGKIDDENGIAVDASADDSGCSISPREARSERFVGFVLAACILGWRRRKRPLSS